jgi:acetyl-CoA carboxylase carboxyl transferase subunit beta
MASIWDKFRSQKPRIDSSETEPAVPAPAQNPPSDLWVKCSGCGTAVYRKTFQENLKVCEKCGHHHKLTAWERVESLCDEGSFQEIDSDVISCDPLEIGAEYTGKLAQDRQKTQLSDAILTGVASIDEIRIALGVMDFHFRGGSMGSAVGEKITSMLETALDRKVPALMVTSSGGARMQEGMLSLMQMARTSAAVRRLNHAGIPYIVILTDPTTAGVAASFASLGDVIIAEPGAIIGFSGARVIEQTIRQKLPPGFQTSEFYEKHGFIDKVVKRSDLKATTAQILSLLTRHVEVVVQ